MNRLPRTKALLPLLLALGCGEADPEAEKPAAPPLPPAATYVDSRECEECHEKEYAAWKGSDHDLAIEPSTEKNVLGDFDDAVFEHFGVTTRFFRRDGAFLVNTEGPDGEYHDYEIAYNFGFEPLQQYLIAFPGGRFQCLGVAWDTVKKEWFHLYPNEHLPPDDQLHWTRLYQNWNMMCAECHSTLIRKSYDLATRSYDTTWEEIDVGCQACHGPGSRHIEITRPWEGLKMPEGVDDGLELRYRGDDPARMIDVCAPCHSRRQPMVPFHVPGDPYHDDYQLSLLRPELYHVDGQILDEVYVVGSFMQSRMFEQGVTCNDCHDPHTTKIRREGDALCTECHDLEPPIDRFMTLQAKDYTSVDHHHHPVADPSARCVACHMPTQNYMVVDPRNDHSMRIPRPDLTEALGTIDACSRCHKDHPVQWSVEWCEKWYPHEPTTHFGEVLARLRAGDPGALEATAALLAEPATAGIVRATIVDELRYDRWGPGGAELALGALQDESPLVRAAAAGALEQLPDAARAPLLAPLLEDPTRLVRAAAARALVGPAEQGLDERTRPLFDAALEEYVAAQHANDDMPGAHLNLGFVASLRGDSGAAEAEYRTALSLDPDFLPAVFNLANLLAGQHRPEEAETILAAAVARHPAEGELHYSMALLLGELQRLDEAIEELREAARLLPDRPRVQYNLGLALQQRGRTSAAERALLRAIELDPRNPDFLYALSLLYREQGQLEPALDLAIKLADLLPRDPGPRQLVEELQRRLTEGR